METKILSAFYERSDTIEHQGNRKSIQKYLNNGYNINQERNGFWVLTKPVRALITIGNSKKRKTFDMKEDICQYYGKQRISKKMFDNFCNEAKEGKIKFTLDSDGSYTFK